MFTTRRFRLGQNTRHELDWEGRRVARRTCIIQSIDGSDISSSLRRRALWHCEAVTDENIDPSQSVIVQPYRMRLDRRSLTTRHRSNARPPGRLARSIPLIESHCSSSRRSNARSTNIVRLPTVPAEAASTSIILIIRTDDDDGHRSRRFMRRSVYRNYRPANAQAERTTHRLISAGWWAGRCADIRQQPVRPVKQSFIAKSIGGRRRRRGGVCSSLANKAQVLDGINTQWTYTPTDRLKTRNRPSEFRQPFLHIALDNRRLPVTVHTQLTVGFNNSLQ